MNRPRNFARQLRILRNLIEASSNEIRRERMPTLLADVHCLMIGGTLEDVSAFNPSQVAEERLKDTLLISCPEIRRSLFRLEDHWLLRGCLAAFELDEHVFEQRAAAFHRLFVSVSHCQSEVFLTKLTGALLATGDYSRTFNGKVRFGSSVKLDEWRHMLTGTGRDNLKQTRDVLGCLLNVFASTEDEIDYVLDSIVGDWLDSIVANNGLDWRWYLVKYPIMRKGESGIYVVKNEHRYSLYMLNKTNLNGYYRDPYLSAIHQESGVGDAVEPPWFIFNEPQLWMRLKKSGVEIRCIEDGFELRPPQTREHLEIFSRIGSVHGIDSNYVLHVPQVECDSRRLDASDRVCLGVSLVQALVDAGL